MFGSREKERKWRKKEKSEKRELKASQKFIAMLIDVHLLQTEAYICSKKGKLQNNMKQQNYSEGRNEKNQKRSRLDQKQEQIIFAMHSDFRCHSEKSL